jgi:hypothetical protein
MAGDSGFFQVHSHPTDLLLSMGNGNLMQGVRNCQALAKRVGKCFHNCMMSVQTATVASNAFTVSFKVWQPFLLTGIYYNNSTTAGTKITAIKVDGELMLSRGFTGTASANALATDFVLWDGVDWICIFPAGSEITIEGTATTSDVLVLGLIGWDLNWEAIG